jgi:hypothetical protein
MDRHHPSTIFCEAASCGLVIADNLMKNGSINSGFHPTSADPFHYSYSAWQLLLIHNVYIVF